MKNLFLIIIFIFISGNLVAKDFNLKTSVDKCKKCHGKNFDKKVLNANIDVSKLTKKELMETFSSYLSSEGIGRKRLMKIILKKYTPEQRELIAEEILKLKNSKEEK